MAGGFIGVVSPDVVDKDHCSMMSGTRKDAKSMSDRRSSEGKSNGVFQPWPDVIFDGEDPPTWGFEGEDSRSLGYEQSVALVKHREHCGNRRSQRPFAVAQVTQDPQWEGGASIIDMTPDVGNVCDLFQLSSLLVCREEP